MGFVQAYKMAIKSILSNKMRSFLTMLGVIIGVGAVIAAVAFAQGSTSSITQRIQGMGTNLIQISITGRNSNRNLSYAELLRFARDNSQEIVGIAPTINGSVTVKVGDKTRSTSLLGTNDQYSSVRNVNVQSGRFLMSYDVDSMQKVAVIGTAVMKDVFSGSSPLGKIIKVNGQEFKVIGVLEETASGQDQSADDQVIIPVTVGQRLMKSALIRNFSIQAATPEAVDTVMTKTNNFLMGIYRNNQNSRAFRVFNQAAILTTLSSVTDTMKVVLGGIAAISLVVGGIGIMNIMLVSVSERTREIGIRKAIGAKRKNILIQFLIEALMVTGIGGLMGVLFGLSIIKFVIGGMKIVPEVYSPTWIVISFGISLLVGVVFGLFPAYKASNLNPIEALRFE